MYKPLAKVDDAECDGIYICHYRNILARTGRWTDRRMNIYTCKVFLIKDGEIVNVWHLGEEGRTEYRNSNIEWFRSLNVEPDSEIDSIYVKGFMNFTS